MTVTYDDDHLTMYAVPGRIEHLEVNRLPAIISHLLWAAMVLGALGAVAILGMARLRADKARKRPTID